MRYFLQVFVLVLLMIIYTMIVLRIGYAWGDRDKDARADSVPRRPLASRCPPGRHAAGRPARIGLVVDPDIPPGAAALVSQDLPPGGRLDGVMMTGLRSGDEPDLTADPVAGESSVARRCAQCDYGGQDLYSWYAEGADRFLCYDARACAARISAQPDPPADKFTVPAEPAWHQQQRMQERRREGRFARLIDPGLLARAREALRRSLEDDDDPAADPAPDGFAKGPEEPAKPSADATGEMTAVYPLPPIS